VARVETRPIMIRDLKSVINIFRRNFCRYAFVSRDLQLTRRFFRWDNTMPETHSRDVLRCFPRCLKGVLTASPLQRLPSMYTNLLPEYHQSLHAKAVLPMLTLRGSPISVSRYWHCIMHVSCWIPNNLASVVACLGDA
jgi:hypothetical protein